MFLVDAHCDSILECYRRSRSLGIRSHEGHLDLPRLMEAGVKIQFFALFPETIYKPHWVLHRTLELLDFFWEQYEENKNTLQVIMSKKDLEECLCSDKIGAVLAVEGGEALEGDLRMLKIFYRLGVRSLGLTWNQRNEIADGVAEEATGGGLTRFGRQVVREMNKLGMLIDVSHLSERGFWDVLEVSEDPVIASHSNCREVWDHPRNLTDRQLMALAGKGGVVCINLVPGFLGPEGAGLGDFLDHIDHACDVVGDDYVGVGSDFDGTDVLIPEIPDVTKLFRIVEGLHQRGYAHTSIEKICGKNCLRVLKKVLR